MRGGLRFDEIEEGDSVSFVLTETDKGEAAIDVEIVGRPLASLPHGAGDEDVYDGGAEAS